ncbi:MAG: YfhO family protein, partial [Actinomycetota bacterium]
PAALRARRRRALVVAFGVVLAGAYVAISNAVLAAGPLRRAVDALPFGDVLLHNPGRLRYAAVLALPALGAAGIQGLLEDRPSWRATTAWLAGGAALWLGLPLLAGGDPMRWALFAVVLVPAACAILLARARPAWAPALVCVLALEIVAAGALAGRWHGDDLRLGLEAGGVPLAFQPLRMPEVDLGAFLAPPAFVDAIGFQRYLTWAPPDAAYAKGYLFAQDPWDWPMLVNERGTLFARQDVLGYNPVQLRRYWTWIRATNALPLFYNATSIQRPTTNDVGLLSVRFLIVPQGVPSPVPGRVVQTADGYDLVRLPGPPLVSAPTHVHVAASPDAAIASTLVPGFDPSTDVIVERRPGIAPGGIGGDLSFAIRSPEELEVRASLASDAVVLVRVAYDPGWTASVDGAPAAVLSADGFLLGVPVHAGDHTVTLTYHDPHVVDTLWWSAAVWVALLLAWLGALGWEWRAASRAADGA